jgi:hypothetical protein
MTVQAAHVVNNTPKLPPCGDAPLRAGSYSLEIVESDYKANSKGTGMALECKARVVGGEFDGRPFHLRYNLESQNEETVEIGQRDFRSLLLATGVLEPKDSSELHFQPFRVMIGIKTRKDTGEFENVVKKYRQDAIAA